MGKASISIAVTGSYNGAALERAESRLDSMSKKVAGASKNMNVAGREMVESGAKLANAGGEIYNTGAKIESAGNKMMGVTAVLGGVGVASFKTASDFESSMARVAGALDIPQDQMGDLRDLALKTGEDTIFSASEAGSAMEELAKGGLTEADIQGGALATTMNLAAAGGLDLATAANTVVQSMGAFNLTADQTGEAANALAGAAAASSADVSDLSQGLSQVSAQAHSAGWNIQDTSAVLAAFADAGIKGSDAGTSLKTMLQRLAAPTDKAADEIESLGINVRDNNGHMKDAKGIAQELQDKLGGLSSAEKDAAMQTIFGSDASRAALVMTNLGSAGLQKYTDATNDQTAAQRMANSQMGESQSAIEQMNGAIETASINVGDALAPAVTDAANAVGEAAHSFSSLDDGTQKAIVGFGAVVAAAGPVLSVTGKVVKGVGSMVTVAGKAKQTIGTYADALTTTDAAALKAYSSNEKLSGALKSNPAAKAAGGVDKYVQAVQNANRDTSQYKRAVRELSNEQKKGIKANQELVANLKKEVDEKKSAMDASTSLVSGYQEEAAGAAASTAATKAHAIGLGVLSAAANVAKVALATIAPMAIVAGITLLVTKFQEAKQHADNLAEATSGLEGAASGATNEVNNEASAFDLLTGNAGKAKVDVDGMLESQAQLAQTMRDTNTNAAAQQTQLQNAYMTIQQYANQSDLSTEAQGRLRSAVETVNDMCGTQISVTDAANGVLSDENGAIQDVTGSLGDYVSKKLEQIRVDAQQENLTALYKQQAEDIQTVAKAQKAYNDKLNEHDQYVKNYIATCGPYVQNVEQMAEAAWQGTLAQSDEAKALDESKAALDSCNSSIDNVTASLGATAAAATGAATNIGTIAQASPVVSTAIDAVGGDLTDFSNDLSDAGVSVSEFNSLSQDQLIQLASSWDGTSASIVSTLDGMGVQIQDKGLSAVTALSSGMASGRVSVEASTEVIKAAATGDWSGVASLMQQNGINIPKSVAKGISDGSYQPTAETSAMISAVALQLSGGDVEKAAELLGHDIDAGLAQAIQDNNTDVLTNTYGLTQDTIDKAREGFQTHSPSVVFQEIGGDLDAGLANGIDSNSDGPLTSIGNLVQGIIDALNPLPDSSTSTGSSASSGLAGGLLSNLGLVSGNAALLESGAENGVSGTPGTFSSTGTSAGSLFAQTIGSFFGATTQSGLSLASGASTGVSGTPGALGSTGRQAGANFASGIGSGQGSTSSSARGLGSSAQSGVSGTPGALGSTGRSASSQFASGVGSGQGSTAASAAALAAAARRMTDVGDMHSSGSHLASNFAAGIRAGLGWVSSAANAIANAAKSILGFSVPDEGPWSGAEKGGALSGEHLAKNFAAGMLSGTADVRDAALRLAADASIDGYGFGAGSGRPNRTAVTNNYYSMGNVTIDASSIKEFMTMDEFFRFMRRAKAGA